MGLLDRLRRQPARRDSETLLAHAAALAAQVARIAEAIGALNERARAIGERERALERSLLRSSEALDGRQGALEALARELREREAAVAAREEAAGGRATGLDERERQLAAREEAVGARRAELDARDARAVAEQLALRRRGKELDRRAAELTEAERLAREAAAPAHDPDRSLLFVAAPDGYRLLERDAPPPATGAAVEADGGVFVVVRVAPSPLPGDRRRCAYAEPVG